MELKLDFQTVEDLATFCNAGQKAMRDMHWARYVAWVKAQQPTRPDLADPNEADFADYYRGFRDSVTSEYLARERRRANRESPAPPAAPDAPEGPRESQTLQDATSTAPAETQPASQPQSDTQPAPRDGSDRSSA